MKVLALDTSNKALAVALSEDKQVLAVKKINIKRNHSIQLMPAIEALVQEVGWQTSDIDRIAVAKGPGSYTGVRIAVTTAKSLAWALKCDLVAYSSLEAVALNAPVEGKAYISPVFNARRENIYTGLYQYTEEGNLENVIGDRHLASEAWAERLQDLDGPVLFIGEDVEDFKDFFQKKLGENFHYQVLSNHLPNVELMALLAHTKNTEDIHQFKPDYLKLTEAEENWMKENPDQKRGQYVEKINTMD